MGKKKDRARLEQLAAAAEDAADRAEKAADRARKQRKRAEAAVRGLQAPQVQAPEAGTPHLPALPAGEDLSRDLTGATKAQLLDLARSAGVPGRSRMNRDELVDALGGR